MEILLGILVKYSCINSPQLRAAIALVFTARIQCAADCTVFYVRKDVNMRPPTEVKSAETIDQIHLETTRTLSADRKG